MPDRKGSFDLKKIRVNLKDGRKKYALQEVSARTKANSCDKMGKNLAEDWRDGQPPMNYSQSVQLRWKNSNQTFEIWMAAVQMTIWR